MNNNLINLLSSKDLNTNPKNINTVLEAMRIFEEASDIIKRTEEAMGIKTNVPKSVMCSTLDLDLNVKSHNSNAL
jgi:uncharacterized protein YqgV (UPF0045/DUF77 family)